MYELVIANKTYSSWSMRVWLVMKAFNIPFNEQVIRFDNPNFKAILQSNSLYAKVPILKKDSFVISDSLSIMEYLAENHSDLALWPKDEEDRIEARSLCAYLHAGYPTLRSECPLQFQRSVYNFKPSKALMAEIVFLEMSLIRLLQKTKGYFLFGNYSIADAYYAPLLSRFHTYGLALNPIIVAYFARVQDTESYKLWVEDAKNEPVDEFVKQKLDSLYATS